MHKGSGAEEIAINAAIELDREISDRPIDSELEMVERKERIRMGRRFERESSPSPFQPECFPFSKQGVAYTGYCCHLTGKNLQKAHSCLSHNVVLLASTCAVM